MTTMQMATPVTAVEQLPENVRKLPPEAQQMWTDVYNAHCDQHGDAPHDECAQLAWEAVKQYFQLVGGQWTARDSFEDKEFSAERRRTLAKKGHALPDGSFPIESRQDLLNAIKAVGRASNRVAAIRHIKKRARALGLTDLLPDDWKDSGDAVAVHLSDALLEFDDAAKVRITGDGYLIAQPRIARTGIQTYRGFELGRPDVDRVRVFRPEAEVFSKDALRSYANKPVTLEHPPQLVDAKNWKEHTIGQTDNDVLRDGEYIRVPMMVMDAAAISEIRRGRKELSVGYSADLVWRQGVTDSGDAYDAIQTNIRANHLAVVASARGGSRLTIGDDHNGGDTMTSKSIVVDSVSLEMTDTAAAVVQRALATRDQTVDDLRKQIDTLQGQVTAADKRAKDGATAHDSAIQAKDGEIAVLKKQIKDGEVTPQKLDAMVKDRLDVIDRARKVLGDNVATDGKTEADIRRQTVAHVLGDAAVKDMTDDHVIGAFRMATDGERTATGGRDRLRRALSDGPAHNSAQARDKAYGDMLDRQANAWKSPTASTA